MKLEDFLVMIVLKLLVMGYLQEGHDKNIRLVDLVKAFKFIIGPFQSCRSYISKPRNAYPYILQNCT